MLKLGLNTMYTYLSFRDASMKIDMLPSCTFYTICLPSGMLYNFVPVWEPPMASLGSYIVNDICTHEAMKSKNSSDSCWTWAKQ